MGIPRALVPWVARPHGVNAQHSLCPMFRTDLLVVRSLRSAPFPTLSRSAGLWVVGKGVKVVRLLTIFLR